MQAINLKLEQPLLAKTEELSRKLNLSRAAYIREALTSFNREKEREMLAERMRRASAAVRVETFELLIEINELDDLLSHE